MKLLRSEPVRLYEVGAALVALLAFYFDDLPVALVLGLLAAVVGVGETVRGVVTPYARPESDRHSPTTFQPPPTERDDDHGDP